MNQLQQSVFLNLSRVSQYQERSRFIAERQPHFAKFRQDEIQNEFEIVDFNGKGKLPKQRIKDYLFEKYNKLNLDFLQSLFSKMKWDENQEVDKLQFCSKYLDRQKYLYHQISQLSSLKSRAKTLKDIYEQTKLFNPKLYATIKITKLFINSDRPERDHEDWMDVEIDYEDHINKLNYTIQQPSYSPEEPSFEVLLPVQENFFFVKYRFTSPKIKSNILGQCYINMKIDTKSLKRQNKVTADITKNNQKKGYCEFSIIFYDQINNVEKQLQQLERKAISTGHDVETKKIEYEYLQYLWGVRHKYPDKIADENVKWMVGVRVGLIVCLGLLSIVVHVLGRSQPLSLILALILAKNWKYVILRNEKFLLSWISITGICLDVIWLSFGAGQISQINFLNSAWVIIATYILIITKIVLLLYLLFVEKSFATTEQQNKQVNDL